MSRHPYWHGMLCEETRDDIAERMRDVLTGNYFTLVTANSYSEDSDRFSAIDVYTSQRLTGEIRVYDDPHIGWSITRLSMGISTDAKTQSEARDGGPHKYVHFTFEPYQFVIDHYAPARYRLRWVFTVEHHDAEETD